MPIKSKAQLRKLFQLEKEGKISEDKLQEFIASTRNLKTLPEKVKSKSKKHNKK